MNNDLLLSQPSEWSAANRDLQASIATASDVEQYTGGECHLFAVALHRITGWTMHVVLDDDDHHWDFDDDSYIASVVHVVVEDDAGYFWDVKGRRPRNGFHAEMMESFDISSYDSDTGLGEEGLKYYVGCWASEFDDDDVDRPLPEYTESDIAEADVVVRRVLANIPEFFANYGPSPR